MHLPGTRRFSPKFHMPTLVFSKQPMTACGYVLELKARNAKRKKNKKTTNNNNTCVACHQRHVELVASLNGRRDNDLVVRIAGREAAILHRHAVAKLSDFRRNLHKHRW